jgi:hypothetical protein
MPSPIGREEVSKKFIKNVVGQKVKNELNCKKIFKIL